MDFGRCKFGKNSKSVKIGRSSAVLFSRGILAPLLVLNALFIPGCEKMSQKRGISIQSPFATEPMPGNTITAAFMTIENRSDAEDVLLSLEADVAEHAEIHTTIQEGGMARMQRLDSLKFAPGEKVELKRGGLHIMLIGLKKKVVEKETINLRLKFREAGVVAIPAEVRKLDAGGGGEHHHH